MQFLNENTLGEIFGRFAHLSEVEDLETDERRATEEHHKMYLLLALLFVLKVLKTGE